MDAGGFDVTDEDALNNAIRDLHNMRSEDAASPSQSAEGEGEGPQEDRIGKPTSAFLDSTLVAGSATITRLAMKPQRAEDFSARRTRFMTYVNAPYIRVDPDVIADIEPYLPDSTELKFVSLNGTKDLLLIITAKSFSTMAPEETGLRFTTEITNIAAINESSIDDRAVFLQTKTPQRYSQRDFELRFVTFESRSDREYFIAHLYDRSDEKIQVITWNTHLRTAEDARKKLSRQLAMQKEKAEAEEVEEGAIETTENDYLEVVGREQLCARLIKEGDLRVLFASEVKTADNKHDIVVLTVGALYLGKVRRGGQVRHRVPYNAIEGIVLDEKKRDLCLAQVDVCATTLRQDVYLNFPTDRLRDTFLRILSKVYEEVIVDRLQVTVGDCSVAKRWLIESQLTRIVKLFQRRRREEETTDAMKESAKWILYLITHHVHALIATLCGGRSGREEGELGFVARAIVSLCDSANTTPELIRCCVEYELLGRCGPGSTASPSSLKKAFFQENTLPNLIINSYLSGTSEQYLQVLLSQVMEDFALDPRTADEELVEDDLRSYSQSFLKAIFSSVSRTGDIVPQQLLLVIALINDVCFKAERAAVAGGLSARGDLDVHQVIGKFLFLKLFEPALVQPREYGLVQQEPSERQSVNIERVLDVLRAAMTFVCPFNDTEIDAFAKSQFSSMKDYLKSLIFPDLTIWARSENSLSKMSSFDFVEQEVALMDLAPHNLKILLAIHRQLGHHSGMNLTSSWYHALQTEQQQQSQQQQASPSKEKTMRGRAKSVLDDSEDDAEAPPPPPEGSQGDRGIDGPAELSLTQTATRFDKAKSISDSRRVRERIEKLEAELDEARLYGARCAESLATATNDALYFKEQAAGYRRALFREKGIPLLQLGITREQPRDLRRQQKEEMGTDLDHQVAQESKDALHSLGVDFDVEAASSQSGDSDEGTPLAPAAGSFASVSQVKSPKRMPWQRHMHADYSSADAVLAPRRRPFGCPMDTYILAAPRAPPQVTSPVLSANLSTNASIAVFSSTTSPPLQPSMSMGSFSATKRTNVG